MNIMPGSLIVIDGTDGTGKATQTQLLIETLKQKGFDVEMADFPQYGKKSAGLVEEYLNGKYGSPKEVGPYRASVFYAVDRYDASFQIKKWLEEGKIVVSNRYVSANMGHQTGKIKSEKERKKFLEWLDDFEFNLFGIPRPDINILLFSNPELNQELVDKKGKRDYVDNQKRDIHEDDIGHLTEAREAFLYVAKKYDWIIVDCINHEKNEMRKKEDIHKEIWREIKNHLKQ